MQHDHFASGPSWRFVERLWRTLEYEEVYLHAYDSVSSAKAGIEHYLTLYRRAEPLLTMRDKRTLKLPDDTRKLAIASIRRLFKDELDQDVGDLKASLVLDFVLTELGPTAYNMGVADAKAFFAERTEDLSALSLDEFTYWPAASRRRV